MQDLDLGEFGFGSLTGLGDLIPDLRGEAPFLGTTDTIGVEPFERQIVGRFHGWCVVASHPRSLPSP